MSEGRTNEELQALKEQLSKHYLLSWVYDSGKEIAVLYKDRDDEMVDIWGWDSLKNKWVYLQTFYAVDYDLQGRKITYLPE